MTDDQVLSGIVQWLAAATGQTVIKAHQSGTRPTKPYVMADLTDVAPINAQIPETALVELASVNPQGEFDVKATPRLKMEWRIMVTAFGDAPTSILRPAHAAAQLPQLCESIRPLSIHDIGRVQDVPEWVKNAWEPRAVMMMNIHGHADDGFVIDVFDTLPSEPFAQNPEAE